MSKQAGWEHDSPAVPEALRPLHSAIGRRHEAGAMFEQGSHGRLAYLVESGKVKITQFTGNGYSNVLAILGPGDVFGELSLFDGGVRSASAHAVTPVTLRELDRHVLDELLKSDLRGLHVVDPQLARRLRRANDAATDLAFSDVRHGVAQVILDLADQFGEEVDGRRLPRPRAHPGRARAAGRGRAGVGEQGARVVRRPGLDHLGEADRRASSTWPPWSVARAVRPGLTTHRAQMAACPV